MARYRVTERQVVTYTWEVDSEDYDDEQSLQDALAAIDGVPDNARSTLQSETSHEQLSTTIHILDPTPGTWFPLLPGDQPNEVGNIPIGQTEEETPEEEET